MMLLKSKFEGVEEYEDLFNLLLRYSNDFADLNRITSTIFALVKTEQYGALYWAVVTFVECAGDLYVDERLQKEIHAVCDKIGR